MDRDGFPRHRAAASLKHFAAPLFAREDRGFPRHRAAASLKRRRHPEECQSVRSGFSAASGRGLIEADARARVRADLVAEVFRGIGPRPH